MSYKEIYEKTGTLAPLVNQREYTDDEKTVLLHFFTNVDKNVYCATDNLSSQLWAFLVGQYSRSALSMRDRFLSLFKDQEKALEKGKLDEQDFISIKVLAESIRNNDSKELKFFNSKASQFLKKWGVDYGHNSLKDADRIRFAIEGISQVLTKIIESPFPCLGDFQEKSTRYVHFGKESILSSPILAESDYADEIKELSEELITTYEEFLPLVKKALIANGIIKKDNFKFESAYERTLNAKAFDIVRYLLPSSVATCLGTGLSARTCETHISEMLSHPLLEARLIAKSMHTEALKVSPGLLSHVGESDFLKPNKQTIDLVEDIFYKKEFEDLIIGPQDAKRARLIQTEDIDSMVTASIMFYNSRRKGASFFDCLVRAKNLSPEVKENIISSALKDRGEFDRMPRAIQHGTIFFEFLCDFGAYRDIQRHRATKQLWQGATAIHGYDYPEFINLPGFEEFKKAYDNIMTKVSHLSRKIIKDYPFESEYVSALGHLVQTTCEMDLGQLAYVSELRTTPQGHHSYRNLYRQVYKIIQEKAPIYSKFIRVKLDESSSRQSQEEKAAEKRVKLGI